MRFLFSIAVFASVLAAAQAEPAPDPAVVHVLNRLGYGPRPGDLERVAAMGIPAYIDEQLHPDRIDDRACEKALAPLETLAMSAPDLVTAYFADVKNFISRQKAAGGADTDMKVQYGLNLEKAGAGEMAPPTPRTPGEFMQEAQKRVSVRAVGELQTAKVARAVESERQLQEVLVDFWSNHFNIDVKKAQCRTLKVADDREVIRPHVLGRFRDLLEASAKSPAMLAYLDNKDNTQPRELSVAQQQIRAAYVARMTGADLMPVGDQPKMEGGFNENYGREILELHTLGVDGGYTQKDVQDVARCFTGWGVRPQTGTFEFHPFRHDNSEKTVLGVTIPAGGGESDGERVLDLIAAHPATARHIAFELCQRFVADEPPPALVEHIAGVFSQTNGDLREVIRAILTSPEFSAPEARQAKIKSPFEFAVSSVRALGGHMSLDDPSGWEKARWAIEGAATIGHGGQMVNNLPRKSLNWRVYQLGQPLFAYAAPTGWPEDSRKWVSAGALIGRLNFALDLTSRKVADVRLPSEALAPGVDLDKPEAVIDKTLTRLVPAGVSDATRQVLLAQTKFAEDGGRTVNPAELTALVLGSPEFQRR